MKAGRLRNAVSIQARARSTDAAGGDAPTWATVPNGDVYADIRPASGASKNEAAQLQQVVTHKITIRYLDGVTTANRILFGSRVFDIVDVINWGERDREMSLICLERKATD